MDGEAIVGVSRGQSKTPDPFFAPYSWGANGFGQLGDGTNDSHILPTQIDPNDLTNVIAVAASYGSSYALRADGALWAWGQNAAGQIAQGTNRFQYNSPQLVAPPDGYRFTSISADSLGYFAVATVAVVPEPAHSVSLLLLSSTLMAHRRRRPTATI
jgi:hypothetical protein